MNMHNAQCTTEKRKPKTTENEYLNEICRFYLLYLRCNHRLEFRHHAARLSKWSSESFDFAAKTWQSWTLINTYYLFYSFTFVFRTIIFCSFPRCDWRCNVESLFWPLILQILHLLSIEPQICEVSFCGLMRKMKSNVMFWLLDVVIFHLNVKFSMFIVHVCLSTCLASLTPNIRHCWLLAV